MKKKHPAKILLSILLCALLVGCSAEMEPVPPELLPPANADMATVVVARQDVEKIELFPGSVTARVEELYYTRSGRVGEVLVSVGDMVRAGDVLVVLDTEAAEERRDELLRKIAELEAETRYQTSLYAIELEKLAAARTTLYRNTDLFDNETATLALEMGQRHFLERQELALSGLQRELAEVESVIAGRELLSPVDGCVTYLSVNAGAHVSEYDVIAAVTDPADLVISTELSVSESSTSHAAEIYAMVGGQRISLTCDPFDYDAYVAAQAAGGVYRTTFTAIDGLTGVAAGDYALIVSVRERSEDALFAPRSAVFIDGGETYVYVVADGLSREKREVELGIITDYGVEIKSGVEEGEVLYVAG